MPEAQAPILCVAYTPSNPPQPGWRLVPSDRPGILDVVVGRSGDGADSGEVTAIYRWSRETRTYQGPAGGVDQGFLRIESEKDPNLEQFARRGPRWEPPATTRTDSGEGR